MRLGGANGGKRGEKKLKISERGDEASKKVLFKGPRESAESWLERGQQTGVETEFL